MKRFLIAAAATAVLLFAPVSGSAQDKPDPADTYRLLNLFGDVFEKVRADYVEEIGDKELIEAAITGMLSSLDPHSSYMSADSFREMQVQTRGQFGGLGIQVTLENGLIKVISPIDDTPAFRAGVKAGDLVTHLDKDPVMGLTLSEAVEKMRGPVGADIVLTIRRDDGEPFDITITRDVIKISSVRSRVIEDVGYVRITQFNEQALPGLKKAIIDISEEMGETPLAGLVLDLRNNPGGLLDQAIGVSDAFLVQGEIVSTRARRTDESQRFNARAGDLIAGLPLIVLINGGSASASEIVAGALQDHQRALVLGTKSFGKGSVQTILPLGNHGAMRLTTSRYYTPSGRSIQAVGIEPDILVEAATIEKAAARNLRRESDLRGALEQEDEKLKAEAENGEDGDSKAEDYQLSRAVDLLRGLVRFKQAAN